MKNILLVLLVLITANLVHADFTVKIEITERPHIHMNEPVYITGNFNKWDPGDATKILERLPNGHYGITLRLKDIPSDRLEFKFTRGDWKTLECTQKGRLEVPRILSLNQDTTIFIHIEGWRDDYPESTASPHVYVLDSSLYIPAFDDYRTVWIYLPEGYASSSERYPVMYMHDGQQMFDEATSTGRIGPIEWGVDEVIDDAKEKYIVVAINHNLDKSKRIEEYQVYPNDENPVAKGREYLAFIVDSLKPLVDLHYRTLSDKEHTTLIGSSMGGLVSLYGGLMYPDVFGHIGVLSPSIWFDDGHIESYIQQGAYDRQSVNRQQYFFYAGSNENRRKPDGAFVQMDHDVQRVIGLLQEQVSPEVELLINPNGRHGGSYWRAVFPVFYDWLTKNEK